VDITIDRRSAEPIYLQIARRIREQVLAGALPDGFRLPPERRLAAALGVNRSTVLNAYAELKADALVEAHVGRGTCVVAPAAGDPAAPAPAELPWRQLFRATPGQDPLLSELLALTERDDVIPLSVGLPAPDLVPLEAFRETLDRLLTEHGSSLLLHCPTEGHTPLRRSIARWSATRGICCDPAQVLVVSGAQQGLDLVARALIEPGDPVVIEEPTYCGAIPAFRAAGARLIGVPVDDGGMRTDVLEAVLQRVRPKLIYTLPTFQNPSGVVMGVARRRRLLELATRAQVPVLEDDPYSDLRYEGEALPSLAALDRAGAVIHLGTFSKVLFPGFRLGWVVAARPVVRRLTLVKQAVDLHTNTPGQWVLDAFLRDGRHAAHLDELRRTYAGRRDAMLRALEQHAPPGVRWNHPQGGFYIWCTLPAGADVARLLTRAAERGVTFLPGPACHASPPDQPALRLVFSLLPAAELAEGVARLMAAVRDELDRPRGAARGEIATPPIV